MEYLVSKITSVKTCDDLLNEAREEKILLEREIRDTYESQERMDKNMTKLDAELKTASVQHQIFLTSYENLAPSDAKTTLRVDLERWETRKAQLERNALTYNAGALLRLQVRGYRLELGLPALEAYIAALTDRKTALETNPAEDAS